MTREMNPDTLIDEAETHLVEAADRLYLLRASRKDVEATELPFFGLAYESVNIAKGLLRCSEGSGQQ